MIEQEYLVGHLCCGSGFGAQGFLKANPRVGNLSAKFRNVGGIDVDAAAIKDFERFAKCKGTVLDLMSLEQYEAFHGRKPPVGWREALPADIHKAMGYERPHIWFISAPCKGFSGLLSEKQSKHLKYQALNELTLRAVWLAMEAYKDDPVEFVLFENVPRIGTRGRQLLDKIQAILAHYGYAFAETTHDCGELGGLAQSRKRFLLVARHMAKVPPFLYEPPKRSLKAVGEVLCKLPIPDAENVGMHRLPALQWKTWVRLAFVEAGSDWRSLNRLRVQDGVLADFGIVPMTPEGTGLGQVANPQLEGANWHRSVLGVRSWDEPSGTVTSRGTATTGAFSIADPRAPDGIGEYQQYGVRDWNEPTSAVINVKSPGQGSYSVADPRSSGPFCGAGKYRVTAFNEPAGTVIAGSTTGQGAFTVADPRAFQAGKETYTGQRHYGVVNWNQNCNAVTSRAKYDAGPWSVADPRSISFDASDEAEKIVLPEQDQKLVAHIRTLDGTWHRPFTTLELAALQSLFDPDDWAEFQMEGSSDSAWRERIGNAVPSAAAAAVATVMGRTLLLAGAGETFMLSADPIWVQPLTIALSVKSNQEMAA